MNPPLDFSRVATGPEFERLGNALMVSILGILDYKTVPPGSSWDYGWDGMFEGVLPFDTAGPRSGIWMIQHKSSKNPEPAKAFVFLARLLKRELLDNAVKQGADYLLLTTPARLKPKQRDELEALALGSKLKGLFVLPASSLEELIRPRQWLLAQFFGLALDPALVPATSSQPKTLPGLPWLDLFGREADLERIGARLKTAPDNSALLLHAPGGFGKSRVLREFARQSGEFLGGWQTVVLRDSGSASDAREELIQLAQGVRPARLCVIVDDADAEYGTRVAPLVHFLRDRSDIQLRLVLGARRGPHEQLALRLAEDGLHGSNLVELALGRVPDEAALEFLIEQRVPPRDAESIVEHCEGDMVLFSHALARAKEGGRHFDFSDRPELVRLVARKFVTQVAKTLDRDPAQSSPAPWLHALAALLPIPHRDTAQMISVLAGVAGPSWAELDLAEATPKLLNADLLRRVGSELRFGNDVLGNLLLEGAVLEREKPFLDSLQALEEGVSRGSVALNLGLLGARGSELAHEWAAQRLRRRAEEVCADHSRKAAAARSDGPFADLHYLPAAAPEAAIRLVEIVLAGASRDAEATGGGQSEPILLQQACRVLRNALNSRWTSEAQSQISSDLAERALEALATGVERLAPETALARRRYAMTDELLDPYSVRPTTVDAVLNTVLAWADPANPGPLSFGKTSVALSVVSSVLAIESHHTEWREGGLQSVTRARPASTAWLQEVDRAKSLWLSLFHRPEPETRAAAIEQLAFIGQSEGAALSAYPLREHVAGVEHEALCELKSLIRAGERALPVLAAIHDRAFWVWITARLDSDRDQKNAAVAEEILGLIPRTPEFRAFMWLCAPRFAVDDFEELRARAEELAHRWEWWIQGGERGAWRGFATTSAEFVADHPTADELVESLRALESQRVGDARGHRPLLVVGVVQRAFETSGAVVRDEALFGRLPERLGDELFLCWASLGGDAVGLLRQRNPDLGSTDLKDATRLLDAIQLSEARLEQFEMTELCTALARNADAAVRELVADRVGWWPFLTPRARLAVALALLEQPTHKTFERLATTLRYHESEWFEGVDLAPLKRRLRANLADPKARHRLDSEAAWLLFWAVEDIESLLAVPLSRLADWPGFGEPFDTTDEPLWGQFIQSPQDAARVFRRVQEGAKQREISDWELKRILGSLYEQVPESFRGAVAAMLADSVPDVALHAAQALAHSGSKAAAEDWATLLTASLESAERERLLSAFSEALGVVMGWSANGSSDPPEFTDRFALLDAIAALVAQSVSVRCEVADVRDRLRQSLEDWRASERR